MKKRTLIGLAVLFACLAFSAFAATDSELLTVTLYGHDYVLGACTPDDFAQNGFGVSIQPDGTAVLLDTATDESIEAVLDGGFVVGLDFQWDTGVDYAYCGLTSPDTWDAVQQLFGAEMNEEGALEARVPLSDGRAIELYTHGELLSVCLEPGAPSSGWPELDDVKRFPADALAQVEVIFSTEGGAQRFVFTDSAIMADLQMFCKELSLGDETDIGVADDGLTLTFSTVWESAALRFEGGYAVVEGKRYIAEHLSWLKTYLKTVIERETAPSDF